MTLAAAAALAAGALVSTADAAPARASTATPAVSVTRIVSGNRTVTASWKAVPHATGYVLRASTKHSMSHPTSVRTTQLQAAVHGLKNGKTAYVRVDAFIRGGSVRSKVAKAEPSAAQPLPVTGVTATQAGPDQVRVHWSGGGTATHVAVLAGGDAFVSTFRFGSAWQAATTGTMVLTVPIPLRATLGGGTGQPVFVRVLETNSVDPHAAKELYSDPAALLALSSYGTWSLAGAVPVVTKGFSTLTVGELNVQSVGSSKGFTANDQWAARAPRVVKDVQASDPALLATAEDSTSLVHPCPTGNQPEQHVWCTDDAQYIDLADQLAAGAHPYALATPDAYVAVQQEELAHPEWKGAVTAGAHLLYDPTRLKLLQHGYISPVFDLHVPGWTPSIADRWLSWAEFSMLDGTRRHFYAVAAHLPVGYTVAGAALRAAEMTRLTAYLDRLDAAGLPIVFAGDLNADPVYDIDPASTYLIRDGYTDASATTDRTNIQYCTQNSANGDDGPDDGYPKHVYARTLPATRIDFIMLKHDAAPISYQNVLHLKGLAFDPAYQGTDHNLQVATIALGGKKR